MGSKVEESSLVASISLLLSVYRRELLIERAKAIHVPGERMLALTWRCILRRTEPAFTDSRFRHQNRQGIGNDPDLDRQRP
jgi:hypothetical protein